MHLYLISIPLAEIRHQGMQTGRGGKGASKCNHLETHLCDKHSFSGVLGSLADVTLLTLHTMSLCSQMLN